MLAKLQIQIICNMVQMMFVRFCTKSDHFIMIRQKQFLISIFEALYKLGNQCNLLDEIDNGGLVFCWIKNKWEIFVENLTNTIIKLQIVWTCSFNTSFFISIKTRISLGGRCSADQYKTRNSHSFFVTSHFNHLLWYYCACWNQTVQEWCLWGPIHKLFHFILTFQKRGHHYKTRNSHSFFVTINKLFRFVDSKEKIFFNKV
jgi:hypothetical protein